VDLLTTIRILLRRWFVVVPALLLTAGAAYLTLQTVKPSYEATGAVVLLGPATAGAPVPGEPSPPQVNPYLEFGGALETTALIVSRSLMSEAAVTRLAEKGATAVYEVGTGSDGGSPLVNVIATDPDEAVALRTVEVLITEVGAELERRQAAARAPRSQFIRAETVTTPTRATPLSGSSLRAVAAVGALGLAASFGLGFLAEAVAVRRRRPRAAVEVPGQHAAPDVGWRARDPDQSGAEGAGRVTDGPLSRTPAPGPNNPWVAASRSRDPKH
jgi:hypothetical protein